MRREILVFLASTGIWPGLPDPATAQDVSQEDAVGAIAAAIAHFRSTFVPRSLPVPVIAVDKVRSETEQLPPSRAPTLGDSVGASTASATARRGG